LQQPSTAARRPKGKTAVFAAIVALSNVAGNALLNAGMKQFGEPQTLADQFRAVFQPAMVAGILLLVVWMLSKMALLSWADLSYALPVTAIGYALNALAGSWFFGETISATRWLGVAAIVAGVFLVGRTGPAAGEGGS
jgi:drug/metabolite transporter (DMT)-like permease